MRRIGNFLQTAAAAERTDRRNRQLAQLLALVAGILNSVGFVAVALYTSHMTGLTAMLADALILDQPRIIVMAGIAIVAFVIGAMTCAIVFNWGRRREHQGRYATVLLIEGGAMLAFGALVHDVTWVHRDLLSIAVLCFTMGLQNAIITKISKAQIRTTHITGMVTDIGIELGKLLYRNRLAGADPVRADLDKLWLLTSLVGLFFIGGVLGAAGYLAFGFYVLVPLACVLLIVAAWPTLLDLSIWWRTRAR